VSGRRGLRILGTPAVHEGQNNGQIGFGQTTIFTQQHVIPA
jgi:hypothetical protein